MMEKFTSKLREEISKLSTRLTVLEEKFAQFVDDSESEHNRIKHEANILIQQQRDVIQQLTEELERERRDRRNRRAKAIAQFKSE
jgi:hypothetical protein